MSENTKTINFKISCYGQIVVRKDETVTAENLCKYIDFHGDIHDIIVDQFDVEEERTNLKLQTKRKL